MPQKRPKILCICLKNATNFNMHMPQKRQKILLTYTAYCTWSVFNLILQARSNWSLFNGTWQKRHSELNNRLGFEIGEMMLTLQYAVYICLQTHERKMDFWTSVYILFDIYTFSVFLRMYTSL